MEVSEKRLIIVRAKIFEKTSLQITVNQESGSVRSNVTFNPIKPTVESIYKFLSYPHECGYKEIEIKVFEGSLQLTKNSAIALYPGVFRDGFHSRIRYQKDYVEWFYSDTHELGIEYKSPSILKFKHLMLYGPNFVDKNEHGFYNYCSLIDYYGLTRIQVAEKLSQLPT